MDDNTGTHYSDLPEQLRNDVRTISENVWSDIVAHLDHHGYELNGKMLDIVVAGSFGCRPSYSVMDDDADWKSDFDMLILMEKFTWVKPKDGATQSDELTLGLKHYNLDRWYIRSKEIDFQYRICGKICHYVDLIDRSNFKNKLTNQLGSINDVTATSVIDLAEFKTHGDARNHYISEGRLVI